ncbi:MAG: hypothetical protein ACK5AZ_13945 [Bryobacteraceae bacterium]
MKDQQEMFDVVCPCCEATLRVDPATRSVITAKAKEKPPAVEDLQEAVKRLKGESARRDEAFRKSMETHKSQQAVLSRKFDELLKQAKSDPDQGPPRKDIDWD